MPLPYPDRNAQIRGYDHQSEVSEAVWDLVMVMTPSNSAIPLWLDGSMVFKVGKNLYNHSDCRNSSQTALNDAVLNPCPGLTRSHLKLFKALT